MATPIVRVHCRQCVRPTSLRLNKAKHQCDLDLRCCMSASAPLPSAESALTGPGLRGTAGRSHASGNCPVGNGPAGRLLDRSLLASRLLRLGLGSGPSITGRALALAFDSRDAGQRFCMLVAPHHLDLSRGHLRPAAKTQA